MTEFSEKSLIALGEYYVYGLVDPRSNTIFYVGKGSGNRVFQHEFESMSNPKHIKLKLETISEIKASGHEIEKVIFNCNLNEKEAFVAESALINALNYLNNSKLTNEISGHHFHEALTVGDFENQYGAAALKKEDIKHNLLIIKINKLYNRGLSAKELYDTVRGVWRLSLKNAEKVDYVLGVYHSLVVAVYKPDQWYKFGEITEYAPERIKGVEINETNKNRLYFVDNDYESESEERQLYLNKTIIDLKYNALSQNPISYMWK